MKATRTNEEASHLAAITELVEGNRLLGLWREGLEAGVREAQHQQALLWEAGIQSLQMIRGAVDANLAFARDWTSHCQRIYTQQLEGFVRKGNGSWR